MQNNKQFDLEERTFLFAKKVKEFVRLLSRNLSNIEYGKQLLRSSGSVAANYIEANESFSKKDYYMRVKICRKEAKESRLWLRLIDCKSETEKQLIDEAGELMKIFGAIATKS